MRATIILVAGATFLAACNAPASATLVRVNGVVRWYEHPLTQADIAQCRKMDRQQGTDNACGIDFIERPPDSGVEAP